MRKSSSTFWIRAGLIGAVYTVLNILIAPLSYGAVQIRVSEALTALVLFDPAAIAGLGCGCFLSNIFGPQGWIDAVVGTSATLLSAFLMRAMRKKPLLAFLPNVVIKGIFIGLMLYFMFEADYSPLICMAAVGAGEAISCYALGYPLYILISKRRREIK